MRLGSILFLVLAACHSDHPPSAEEAAALAPLLAGAAPALVGPVAKLGFGMSHAEVRRLTPALVTSERDDLDNYRSSVAGFPSAELRLDFEHGWLDSVDLMLPHRDLKKLLTEHWGSPASVMWRGDAASIWRNPTTKIRAVLRRFESIDVVSIEPYVPVDTLVAAMEPGGPLIGASIEELRHRLGPRLHEETAQELAESQARIQNHAPSAIDFGDAQPLKAVSVPELELEHGMTNRVNLEYRGDTVTAVSFSTHSSTPQTDQALRKLSDTATRHVVVAEDAGDHSFKITLTAK